MKRVSKQVASAVLGGAVGCVLSPVVEKIYPGVVPLPIPSPWNKNEVFWPLVASGSALVGGFLIDKDLVSDFLISLGTVGIVSTTVKAMLTPVTARAPRGARLTQQMRQQMARRGTQQAPMTQQAPKVTPVTTLTSIPPSQILA